MPSRSDSSELEKDRIQQVPYIVEQAVSGDMKCLEELINLYHSRVFQMVYYRTKSHMDAEDLTQEIFIKMANSLHRLKEPHLFKEWLFRIAVNRVRDFHRRKRIVSFFFSPDGGEDAKTPVNNPNPLEEVMKKEFWEHFHELIQSMPRMEREVFTLRYLDQLGIKEIAGILEKSESTVKTHLYRSLKKFKEATRLRSLIKRNAS